MLIPRQPSRTSYRLTSRLPATMLPSERPALDSPSLIPSRDGGRRLHALTSFTRVGASSCEIPRARQTNTPAASAAGRPGLEYPKFSGSYKDSSLHFHGRNGILPQSGSGQQFVSLEASWVKT